MTSAELTDLQRSLRSILPDPDRGVFAVLDALKKILPELTAKYTLVFQLETRLNALNRDRIRGLLSQDDLDIAYNRITADVLNLIDRLETEDFDPKTAESSVVDKSGSILYRIPHTMEVGEEYRCVVRLGFDEEVVVQKIELSKDTVVKDIRVSEVMEVELLDPNTTPCFSIKRISSVEQFLTKNEYTEWIFTVEPLVTGTLPLLLKVSVKELILNKERVKEIVLEEIINVIAEAAPDGEDTTFRNSGYTISYSMPFEHSTGTDGRSRQKMATLLVLGLVVATGILAAVGMLLGWIPTPPWLGGKKPGDDDRAFWSKMYQEHTRSSFETYLLAYPDGIFSEEARFKVDSFRNLNNRPEEIEGEDPEPLFEKDSVINTPETPPAPAPGKPPVKPGKKKEQKAAEKPQEIPLKTNSNEVPAKKEEAPAPTPTKPEQENAGKKRKSGFEMVSVPGGKLYGVRNDCPGVTNLAIRAFKIGRYEITQHDWWSVMGNDPSFHSKCPECPVERVSWNQVQEFIKRASEKMGKRYRLPYELEWEWAARGGPESKGYTYAGGNDPNAVAWFNIIQEKTHEVGTKRANELGIYDMSGNVWEWCLAPYPPDANCKPSESTRKFLRGGSWADNRSDVKITSRRREKAKNTDRRSGLRLVEE